MFCCCFFLEVTECSNGRQLELADLGTKLYSIVRERRTEKAHVGNGVRIIIKKSGRVVKCSFV